MNFRKHFFFLSSAVALFVSGCFTSESTQLPPPPQNSPKPAAQQPRGSGCRGDWCPAKASFYGAGDGFAGQKTASGEEFDPAQLTAAHRTLPFGSRVTLRNPGNGKEIVVRINDRGPQSNARDIDLSARAAKELGILKDGVADLEMKIQ